MLPSFPEYNEKLRESLNELGNEYPDLVTGFSVLNKAVLKSGALESKIKEIIALSIAITVRCNGCIAYHVHDALKAGATTRDEILEAIGVAVLMGGGPAMVYGTEAMEALKQYEDSDIKV
jgi:AhpD family alkylhydroperoxidase